MRKFLAIVLLCLSWSNVVFAKPIQPIFYGDLSELFQLRVIAYGLEKMGYDVAEPIQAQIAPIFLAIATGNADFYASYWDPMGSQYYEKFDKTGKIRVLGTMVQDLRQGILIDKKTSDAFGIKTYADLRKKHHLLKKTSKEKVSIIGCEFGWVCNENLKSILEQYQLADYYQIKIGSYGSLISSVIANYHNQKSVLYYAWEPHWVHEYLKINEDVIWLKDPPHQSKKMFRPNSIKILANKDFLDSHPDIARFFERISFSVKDMNMLQKKLFEQGNKAKIVDAYADNWLKKHHPEVLSWIVS